MFFMCVLFSGVYQHGFLHAAFSCYDFIMLGGMACAGVEGKCFEFVERQGYCLEEGYVVGDLWLVGFSRATKILLRDMLCSLFRWLFLMNSAYV